MALGLVDALLDGDGETLAAAVDALRDARAQAGGDPARAGWLEAATAFAHWGLERVPSSSALAGGTQAHSFLSALAGAPTVGSTELRRLLEVDETQVSRTGRRLLEAGLVTRRKVGRQVFWQLTPRGRSALEAAPPPERPPRAAFRRDAFRRGFEAASGGPPRVDDPTRERIIECTLGLHARQGIQATTREQIAETSGVPLETVEAMFPTLDELVRACGAQFMESLRLPPSDRAPELFVRDDSRHERIHRLVDTLFGVYEHGADGIAAARREAKDVPALRESVEALDDTLDALVVEALHPERPDPSEVASVRALTDLEIWRALRDQGAAPGAAVDQAGTAVERWLEMR